MVRVVGHKEKPKPEPPELTQKANALLQIMGVVIADKPDAVKNLLGEYGVDVSKEADDHEYTDKLLTAISEGGREFHQDLAELILDSTLDSSYDNFDFKSLLGGKGGDASGDQGSGGGGIMGGITNIIGGIGNAVNTGLQKRQASSQTLQGVIDYRKQQSQTEQSKSKAKMQMLLGLFLLLGICILAIIGFKRKQAQQQQLKSLKAKALTP